MTRQYRERVDVPKYLKIADELAEEIGTGALAPGEPVPSETALVERYGVSGGTVRRAMVELRTRGFIETRHGAGSFVRRAALLEGSLPLPPALLSQLRERHGLTADGLRHAVEKAELSVSLSDDGYVLTYRVPIE